MNRTQKFNPHLTGEHLFWLFVAGTIIFCGLVILQWIQRKRERSHYKSYRSRYIQLVAQLEVVSVMAQQLASFAKNISTKRILDLYEHALLSFEDVLQAFKQVPPFGRRLDVMSTSNILVKQCYERFLSIQMLFRDDVGGRSIAVEKLKKRDFSDVIKGCYFCSRPNIESNMEKVHVKVEKDARDVLSCSVCKEELKHTKKVKVLYFVRDGKSFHWSEMPDYRPSEDYWNINKKHPVYKTRHLELVHTTGSGLSSRHNKDS